MKSKQSNRIQNMDIVIKVLNIRRDKPKSASDMYIFLEEILTLKQTNTLYEIYPDIVDRVMNDRLEDIDLNKLPGIKEYTFNIIKEKNY